MLEHHHQVPEQEAVKKSTYSLSRTVFFCLTLGSLIVSGCMNSAGASGSSTVPDTSKQANVPQSPQPTPTPPVASPSPLPTGVPARDYKVDVMLFNGDGVWASEEKSIKSMLLSHNATFEEVDSEELDAMSLEDITKFGLLIFPGGSGGTQSRSVSAATHARLREAVQKRGVSYIGFCAGAFIAVAPAPAPGKDVSYGFGVVDGPELEYYYLENKGVNAAMTKLKLADGTSKDILWYGGPITPKTQGGVIAKYPDGNPAITQLWSGSGFVILSGVHPTATQNMLTSLGVKSSDGIHLDFAWTLIDSALHQASLPAF
jgi:glutamine amidotransferase-like uncharacterized protein